MLDGYKTYIILVLMAIFNILSGMGLLPGITEADWAIFVNVVLVLLGLIFNYIGRKKLKSLCK